jgi:hypothetical protein
MGILIKENSAPQVAAGTYLAICYAIVDIGTQPDTGFGEKQKIIIMFELPTERATFDGVEKPLAISSFYGKSLSKKANLRKDLVAWRGREFTKEELEGFELKNILGKACQVSVVVTEHGKSKVDGIVALMKGTQVPGITNPLVEYSIHDGKNQIYKNLPEWLRKLCDACIEWDTTRIEETPPTSPSDSSPEDPDIPF